MSDGWAPPIPSRPPGWIPHPQDEGEQYSNQGGQNQQQQQQQHQQQQHFQSFQPQQYQAFEQQLGQTQYPQQPYQIQAHYQQQSYQQPYQQQLYQQPPYQQQQPYQHSYQQPQYNQPDRQQQYNQQHQHNQQQYHQQLPSQHQSQNPGDQQRQIWQPRSGTSWNLVLHDPVKLDHTIEQAEVWIIDIFDNTAETVADLHRRGRKVIGYFSGGTWEDWRPDAKKFNKVDLGKKMDDWEGERWLKLTPAVRAIMIERIDLASSKGFDGIDVDNVDGYDHKIGLSKDEAVDYVKFFAREAHARGLACGLKNASDIIPRVIDDVQWIVQEQCVQYGDEEEYLPFIRQGKPVFHVEYPKGEDQESKKCNNENDVTGKKLQKCIKAKEMGFSTIIKNIKLDQWVQIV